MEPLYAVLFSLTLAVVCQAIVALWKASKSVDHHSGPRRAVSSTTMLGAYLLPEIPGVSAGSNAMFRQKFTVFQKYGWDAYVEISWLGKPLTTFYVADPNTIKEIVSNRARFPKPTEDYGVLAIYGDNVVTTEGDQWRKYKKLVSPAFTDRNNRFVWTETVRIVSELFEDVWAEKKQIDADHVNDLTTQIAIMIIGSAVFGNKGSWRDEDTHLPPGHQMTFTQALYRASSELVLKAAIPNFAMSWTPRLRKTKLAFKELGAYMTEMIEERIRSPDVSRDDLFSNLIVSNSGDDKHGLGKLDVKEITGNLFVFLVAGHETTAHTLSFAFALLSLYPEEQDKLYEQIKSVLGDGRLPSYEDMPLLTRSLGVFYETLRMYPVVSGVPKHAAEDTTLVFGNQDGETKTVPMPRGTRAILHIAGLHYNPLYWKDPYEFKPERFLASDWPKDAFLPFSGGPRACIGRRFSETEGVAALTMIISKYRVSIKEEARFARETFEEKKNRVLKTVQEISLTPVRIPITFTKRD
ncbi:614/534 cytochrome P450 [Coprinopsis marcescibilis]|uniref:614/534 cytochrome P450 n=1 Tax=Coprinopsis marcescibilis TaxID=230819 RepID=A0A5C3KHF0_COPMA|nr:614/534 cytochrome P450 [Coprinopsis marcescibilis]